MFMLYLCLELSYAQIVSSHYMFSLLHILKIMMNAALTLQPIVEYSTLMSMFFSTPLLFLFFSTIPFPFLSFICAHSPMLPFPLLFVVVFQLQSTHLYCYELQNFENVYNFYRNPTLEFVTKVEAYKGAGQE